MSFDWIDYLKIAKELLEDADNTQIQEAYYRSSISRTYYAVFSILRIKADLEKYMPSSNIHMKVIDYYKNSNISNEKQIGDLLDKLRTLRNTADYNRNKNINKEYAERAILKANEILKMLEEGK